MKHLKKIEKKLKIVFKEIQTLRKGGLTLQEAKTKIVSHIDKKTPLARLITPLLNELEEIVYYAEFSEDLEGKDLEQAREILNKFKLKWDGIRGSLKRQNIGIHQFFNSESRSPTKLKQRDGTRGSSKIRRRHGR